MILTIALIVVSLSLIAAGCAYLEQLYAPRRSLSRRTFKDHLAERLPPPPFDHDAAERQLFLEVPSAWWLDPNRWGDNPGWNDPEDRYVYSFERANPWERLPEPVIGPGCLVCGSRMSIATQYGETIELWMCDDCGATRSAKAVRRAERKARLREQVVPGCFGSRPGAVEQAENDCVCCPFNRGCTEASLLPLPPRMN